MHRLRLRSVFFVGLFLLLQFTPCFALESDTEIMPVSQIKIGMKGYGLTVFKGTKIEKFNVEILGVLKRQNLGGDLILVMMSGGPISQRGANIISGMSGSPVYIQGKLIGAISMGVMFPKEPLAIVTPIQDMMEALDPRLNQEPPANLLSVSALETPVQIGGKLFTKIYQAQNTEETLNAGDNILRMVPLSTPIMVSGGSPRSMKYLETIFKKLQIEPVAGPGSSEIGFNAPFIPGAAVGVQLMRGDIDISGIGTLTYRKGNQILAFGHPMLGIGSVDLPLTTGYIYDVVPNLMSSFKLGAPGRMVGSINQDRPWSIAGNVGKMPHLIPVQCTVKDLGSGRKKTLNVEVIDHPLLTSALILVAANQAIEETHPKMTNSMAKVTLDLSSASFDSIHRENLFYDPSMIDSAALQELATVLGMLNQSANHVEKIKKVNLQVEVWDKRQTAMIRRIFLEKDKYEPGETVKVGVILKPYNQEEILRTLEVKIPETAPNGSINLMVSGGAMSSMVTAVPAATVTTTGQAAAQTQQISIGGGMDLPEMIQRFVERDKNNDLVGKLVLSTPGVNIKGAKLLGLPATFSEVFKSPKATGMRFESQEIKTVCPTDWIISGLQTLSITVQRKNLAEKASSGKTETTTSTPTAIVATSADVSDFDEGTSLFSAATPSLKQMSMEDEEEPDSEEDTSTKTPTETSAAPKTGEKTAVTKTETKTTEEKTTEVTPEVKTVVRTPKKWTLNSQSDFEQGHGEKAMTTSEGDVRITRSFDLVRELGEPYIWSLAAGKDGIYAGTGNDGKIYKINPQGDFKIFSETGAMEVQNLAFSKDGNLFAVTNPDATLYQIGADGKAVPVFETNEPYLTSLISDNKGGVYVSTGGGIGRVYQIGPDGTSRLVLDTSESHILSLVCGHDGTLYAGSGESGIVYAVKSDGTARVLYDAEEVNISALCVDGKDNLYAGTAPKGVLYRITPDGTVKKVYDKFKSSVRSLAVDSAGNILALSGSQIYVTGPDDLVTSYDEVQGAQFTSLTVDSVGNVYAGTSNPGILYQSKNEKNQGIYESSIHDTGSLSKWGHILWNAETPSGTSLSLETRTGNTFNPDSSWSEWYSVSKNGDLISNPSARFIQFRALLKSEKADQSPELKSVTVSYLPKNQKPTLTITAPIADSYWSKTQSIKWTASDPDKDTLITEIYDSADSGKTWILLATVDKDSTYNWNTSSVKDGSYLIKVAVSDKRSNPEDPQSTEKISNPVVVCNQVPKIYLAVKNNPEISADKRICLRETAVSSLIPIVGVEWQADSSGWNAAKAESGMFDSPREVFTLTTNSLSSGNHEVQIRVLDAAGNTATETIKTKIP